MKISTAEIMLRLHHPVLLDCLLEQRWKTARDLAFESKRVTFDGFAPKNWLMIMLGEPANLLDVTSAETRGAKHAEVILAHAFAKPTLLVHDEVFLDIGPFRMDRPGTVTYYALYNERGDLQVTGRIDTPVTLQNEYDTLRMGPVRITSR